MPSLDYFKRLVQVHELTREEAKLGDNLQRLFPEESFQTFISRFIPQSASNAVARRHDRSREQLNAASAQIRTHLQNSAPGLDEHSPLVALARNQ